MNNIFLYSESFINMSLPDVYPLQPERIKKVIEQCKKMKLFQTENNQIKNLDDFLKGDEESLLGTYHNSEYTNILKRANSGVFDPDFPFWGIGLDDTPIFKGMYDYALLTVKSTIAACRLYLEGQHNVIFSPIGGFHHAKSNNAEGFCYLNDIVMGIDILLKNNLRVMYIDLDAHHGDGVEDAFYKTRDVLKLSFHESGETLFPWIGKVEDIGEDKGYGYNINVPMPANSDDEIFIWVVDEIIPAAYKKFNPDVVLLQCGIDTLSTDPKTHLNLTNNGFAHAIEVVKKLSSNIIAIGGGGYIEENVKKGWTIAWSILSDQALVGYEGLTTGGNFIGNPELEDSDLRDMSFYYRGGDKAIILDKVQKTLDFIQDNQLKIISPDFSRVCVTKP